MIDYLRVGVVASAHGIRGEVNVYPTTDDPGRFDELDEVILDRHGKRETRSVEGVKYFKQMVILKLEGIDTRNDSEAIRGAELLVTRDKAVGLAAGEYFIGDLVGLEVWTDEGEKFGTLTDVMKTGANDVYVIRGEGDGKEYLFPATRECILSVDMEEKRMTVHILPGLLDL
jgi:16S rRNA processing protein RimM